jgi:hypothetical protein
MLPRWTQAITATVSASPAFLLLRKETGSTNMSSHQKLALSNLDIQQSVEERTISLQSHPPRAEVVRFLFGE